MYGIEELKKIVNLVFEGVAAAEKALADGKIELNDLAFLVPLVLAAGPAVKDISCLPKEVSDLSVAELDELIALVRTKLPAVSKAAAQVRIGAALDVVAALAKCVEAFQKSA